MDAAIRHMLNFARHLPPSAGPPRVLALDELAAGALPPEVEITLVNPKDFPAGSFDAVVGYADSADLARWIDLLRPGGRLILASRARSRALIDSMTNAGYIHCFAESGEDLTLYRGERPALGASRERIANLHASRPISNANDFPPFLHILVSQTPNKPAWKLLPNERISWLAATAIDPGSGQSVLLVFGSLVKAVAFMQPAVRASKISGVNKIGKFSSGLVHSWKLGFALNPAFDDWRDAVIRLTFEVDPNAAVADEE